MREILHIFRKDVRRLRWEILATLAALVLFAWIEPRTSPIFNRDTQVLNSLAQMLRLLLVLAWWHIIATLIHQEAIPGHRQYWLTRPIEWKKLLAAKALLVLVCVNLPLLLAQYTILSAGGFRAMEHLPALLAKQVWIGVLIVFPAAALAVVTRNLAQAWLGALMLALSLIVFQAFAVQRTFQYWGGMDWIKAAVLAALMLGFSVVTILMQYRWRATGLSRAVIALMALTFMAALIWTPLNFAFAVQSRLSGRTIGDGAVRVSFDEKGRRRAADPEWPQTDMVRVDLPMQLAGVPDGLKVWCDVSTANVHAAGGESWGQESAVQCSFPQPDGTSFYTFYVDPAFFKRSKDQAAVVRVSLYLTLFARRNTGMIPVRETESPVPGVGFCAAMQGFETGKLDILCRHPPRGPARMSVRLSDQGGKILGHQERLGSYAPYPYELTIIPVESYVVATLDVGKALSMDSRAAIAERLRQSSIVFETSEPVAHIRRSFEARVPRLGNYATERP